MLAQTVRMAPGEPSASALHRRVGLRRKGGSSCHLIDRPPHARGFPGTTAGIGAILPDEGAGSRLRAARGSRQEEDL
jgi:hypothetical protein